MTESIYGTYDRSLFRISCSETPPYAKLTALFIQTVLGGSNITFSRDDLTAINATAGNMRTFYWRHRYTVMDGRKKILCEMSIQTESGVHEYDATSTRKKSDRFVFGFRVAFRGTGNDTNSPCIYRNWIM